MRFFFKRFLYGNIMKANFLLYKLSFLANSISTLSNKKHNIELKGSKEECKYQKIFRLKQFVEMMSQR